MFDASASTISALEDSTCPHLTDQNDADGPLSASEAEAAARRKADQRAARQARAHQRQGWLDWGEAGEAVVFSEYDRRLAQMTPKLEREPEILARERVLELGIELVQVWVRELGL